MTARHTVTTPLTTGAAPRGSRGLDLRRGWPLVAVAAAALSARPAVACAPRTLVDERISPAGATIAPGGGLVIATHPGDRRDVTAPVPWSAQVAPVDAPDRVTPVELVRTPVAPGLLVVGLPPPARNAGARAVTFLGRDGKPIVAVRELAAKPLAAPALHRAVSDHAAAHGEPSVSPMGTPSAELRLELEAAAPADAIALIVYAMRDDAPSPILWTAPSPSGQYRIVTGGKSCGGQPPTVSQRERLAVAWLDVHGQLSARSAAVTVVAPT